jgi:hypothetical protein
MTQAAAVAELIMDGWTPEQIALDPDDWEFDIGVYEDLGAGDELIIAGEAKESAFELSATLGQMLHRAATRVMPEPNPSTDGDKKYLALAKYRPRYFWAVAPGVRTAYRVDYHDNLSVLIAVRELPRKGHNI